MPRGPRGNRKMNEEHVLVHPSWALSQAKVMGRNPASQDHSHSDSQQVPRFLLNLSINPTLSQLNPTQPHK
jgi:hypothetical protein